MKDKIMRWFVLLLGALAVGWAAVPSQLVAQETGPNLLRNPSFEGGYFAWSGVPEVQVAHEWTPWWIEDTNRDPRWHRPEWKRAVKSEFPNRVLGGDSAQQYFTFFASHYAGMYQQVFDVTPGVRYRFALWVQIWSSAEDNADVSVLPANPNLQIGIDPTGDARPGFASPPNTVVWSGAAPMSVHVDKWGLMTVEAVAQSSTITVYVRSRPDFANKHNDIYIDEASLVSVGTGSVPPPPVTAEPTATVPAPPATATTIVTLEPTATFPPPTATATTIVTAEPTATAVPPTATPQPTATATTIVTAEPPTATATPTAVPPTPTVPATAEAAAIAQVSSPTAEPSPMPTAPPPADNPSPAPRNNTGWLIGTAVLLLLGGAAGYVLLRKK